MISKTSRVKEIGQETDSKPSTSPKVVSVHRRLANPSILFRMLPVQLVGPSGVVNTYAFMDEGSSLTMMDEDLMTRLGINGERVPLSLRWTGGTCRDEPDSQKLSVEVRAALGAPLFKLHDVRTVKSLRLPAQSLDVNGLKNKYDHLRGLPIESYDEATPKILIGIDNFKVSVPVEIREGGRNEPIATKTRLGWAVGGTNGTGENSNVVIHHSFHACKCDYNAKPDQEKLDVLVRKFFEQEQYGAEKLKEVPESKDDQRARLTLETTTTRLDNRYQTGLLWRFDEMTLPDSYPMALRRLICLEKKMSKDPALKEHLLKTIVEFQEKGYISKLNPAEIGQGENVWYLPIFVVANPNKPGKLRVVWDAAAKVRGISLNDVLYKGPDLLTPLADVLWRFREKRIAVCGDLQQMYHQVMVRPEDRNAQRFLWRSDESGCPDVYVMNVMTFGASCSPSAAQYVKNENAQRFVDECPRAVQAIKDNHYVDDWLDCADDDKEAAQLAKDVRRIHKAGGFQVHHWKSNSDHVLNELGVQRDHVEDRDDHQSEAFNQDSKVLGMWWNVVDDTFRYSLNNHRINPDLLNGRQRPTKREVLRITMSTFDPMGLIGHFLVCAKILMQQIWISKIGWDDELLDGEYQNWIKFARMLPLIENVRIRRCFLGNSKSTEVDRIELHVFVDASLDAASAVAYIRSECKDIVHCSLIGSKTKVSPLTPLSIPRLELQAALIGSRLSTSIIAAQTYTFNRTVFWSDSKTVLKWLCSDHRTYKPYVALRLAEIAELTSIKDWRWVPTHENVADEATKWRGVASLLPNARWFVAPKFLYKAEDEWPTSDIVCLSQAHSEKIYEVPNINHFTRYRNLVRSQAYVLRFAKITLQKGSRSGFDGPLTSDELQIADKFLFRFVQSSVFGKELDVLSRGGVLEKENAIHDLSPYIDDDGIMRQRGRIDAIKGVQFDVKRPIILPRDHQITRLIVNDFHLRYLHRNSETVYNELKQRFVIQNLRALIKSIKKECQFCKNSATVPRAPEMGDLPKARLQTYVRPFSFTGVDFFGPIEVVTGRRTEKRYGAIFTCMTVRAIHLEVCHSLSTDSFIMCLQRFISRRGCPVEIRCDNGTNFVGGCNELRKESDILNERKIMDKFDRIVWKFNPPASPHMGGSWERLVRSVKIGLMGALPTRKPNDELLKTIFSEVEIIINSRPLTYVPVECDGETLTPNHFLLGASDGRKLPGEFGDEVLMLRTNWKISKVIANRFWKQWVTEYLPTLRQRTKWHEPCNNIKKGDVVIVFDDYKASSWVRGIVRDTIIGSGGQVRTVIVQTPKGIYTRPAIKVAVLDVIKETPETVLAVDSNQVVK